MVPDAVVSLASLIRRSIGGSPPGDLHDAGGRADAAIVAGIGTGGTLAGRARGLRPRNPEIRIIALHPEGGPVLSCGRARGRRILPISYETASATARAAALLGALRIGISSGATPATALAVGPRREMAGRRIVVITACSAERDLSTELFEV